MFSLSGQYIFLLKFLFNVHNIVSISDLHFKSKWDMVTMRGNSPWCRQSQRRNKEFDIWTHISYLNWIVDKNCIEENGVAFDIISFGLLEPRSHSRFNVVNMNRIISVNEIDEIWTEFKIKRGISFSIAQNFHFATSFGGVAIIGMVVRIKSASQPKLHQQKKRGKRIK